MLNDNMGKKIVEALKMQNSVNTEDSFQEKKSEQQESYSDDFTVDDFDTAETPEVQPVSDTQKEIYQTQFDVKPGITVEDAFSQSITQNLGFQPQSQLIGDVELPTNVAVLNNLISKLPIGVSKQTGALIIKQTMEALGIPMTSVLQEVQQVQDSLTSSARECQKSIIEYKKQINMLEHKAQMNQRQAVALNDIVALFAKQGL